MAANSTLMFSGFNPNARNSSKVLLPPGGGSSDIFGLKVEQPEQERVPPVQEEKDEIAMDEPTTAVEVSTTNNEHTEEDVQPSAETPEEESNKTPAVTSTTPLAESCSPPVAPSPSSADPSPTPPVAGVRGRVPPGGHSSGSFW